MVFLGLPGPARPADPPPSPPSAPPHHTTEPSVPAADQAATASLARALSDAIARADATQFGTLTCNPQTAAALRDLQAKWDAAGPLRVALAGPPVISGDHATVTIRVDGSGGHKETPFPLRRENGRWCVPG